MVISWHSYKLVNAPPFSWVLSTLIIILSVRQHIYHLHKNEIFTDIKILLSHPFWVTTQEEKSICNKKNVWTRHEYSLKLTHLHRYSSKDSMDDHFFGHVLTSVTTKQRTPFHPVKLKQKRNLIIMFRPHTNKLGNFCYTFIHIKILYRYQLHNSFMMVQYLIINISKLTK